MTTDKTGDYQTLYKGAVESAELSPVSRAVANAVIDRLVSTSKAPLELDLAARIKDAAASGNIDQILQLSDKLRAAKADEEAQSAKLRQLAGEYTFPELLKAFPTEFNDLVYELGLLIIRTTEANLPRGRNRGGSRPGVPVPVYVISHNGRTIEASKNVGAAKRPGSEKEFYEFLGFQVSADGRRVKPSTIHNASGEEVAATKKNIIEGILAEADYWVGQGYSAKLKEASE